MGVLYLLAYLSGGTLVALTSYVTLTRFADGRALGGPLAMLAVGVALVIVGAALHTIRLRRDDMDETDGWRPPNAFTYVALALWCLPVLAAWVQFELYVDPLWMFPVTTICGATAFVYLVAFRWTARDPLGAVKRTVASALVGLPLGLFAVGLPLAHFQTHLTSVVLGIEETPREGEDGRIVMEAAEPNPATTPVEALRQGGRLFSGP